MLNGRIYRASFVPFVVALAIAAFSLSARPGPARSTLAPDAFQGAATLARLHDLAASFPQRRPGSEADAQLAAVVAANLKALGGTAGGGFSVRSYSFDGQTIDGERTLTNVVAVRPGSTAASPILLVAHRDAARGPSRAELSATAVLLELARVYAARDTKRTIVIASTSGGSGGNAGVAQLRSELGGRFDAAIVIGDLAGRVLRRPVVIPFSDGLGSAPLMLARTVSDAIKDQAGVEAGTPSALGQLVHLVFPMSAGEQAVLNDAGIPAVMVQASGESGPSAREPLDPERLEALGRSVLSAVDALDSAPGVTQARQSGIVLQRQQLPMWAVRLLVLMLIAPVFATAIDGLARARRRRLHPVRWALWTLSCALPFALTALLARVLGLAGLLGAAPATPVLPAGLSFGAVSAMGLIVLGLCFALAWSAWAPLVRRAGWDTRPEVEVTGLSTVLVALALGLLVWAMNPYAALLLVPALHVWLLLAEPRLRPVRLLGWAGLLALAAVPLAVVYFFYAHQFGLGPLGVVWETVLLLAGGFVGPGAAILWSVALGCAVATALLARVPDTVERIPFGPDEVEITMRGPLTYAGPGSLGGTESALRR